MNIIEKTYRDSTAAVLESRGINADFVRVPGATNESVRKATSVYHESMGTKPAANIPRCAALYADTSAAKLAYAWMQRCSLSEEDALDVMTEVEIAHHGDFVKKALHLLSRVGPYTDRNKIVRELVESLESTFKACAEGE